MTTATTDPTAPINSILDNLEKITQLDEKKMRLSIEQLASQCQQVWEVAGQLEFPDSYRDIEAVVVAGMGGSILGTHVIQTVFKDELKLPITIIPDYTMPAFVNERTLVIASSYSGSTEETLAAAKDAHAKGAKITGITSGGQLAAQLKEWGVPVLVFPTQFNPCQEPRMGLGYSVFGQVILFAKLGLLSIAEADYSAVLATIAQVQLTTSATVPTDKNPAKLLAFEMSGRIPVIIAAEHLEGVAHVLANQLNENGKNYSEYRVIPEINHHLMEGLRFPYHGEHVMLFVTLHSGLYSAHNQRRVILTEEVISQTHHDSIQHELTAPTKLQQAFEQLVFGSYVSFYLAMLNGVNPSPIPWVDWFKAQLAK